MSRPRACSACGHPKHRPGSCGEVKPAGLLVGSHRCRCGAKPPKIRAKDRSKVEHRQATGSVFWPPHSYPTGRAVATDRIRRELDQLGTRMAADPE